MFVTGPVFDAADHITCSFGGKEVDGIYINETHALCITPMFPAVGNFRFHLTINSDLVNDDARFYYCKLIDYWHCMHAW